MSCKVTLFKQRLDALDEAAVRALEKTAEAIHTKVVQAQVIPFRKGYLQNDSTFVDTHDSKNGHVDLVSSKPYARRLYYHPEYNCNKVDNPNAGGKWFDPWLPGGEHEDYAQKAFARLYKREAGDAVK